MFSYIDRKTRENVMIYIAFYLVFTAFLRIEEFTYFINNYNKTDFN